MKRQKNNNNDGDYRCVEAMYRRGCTVDDIVNSTVLVKWMSWILRKRYSR